MATYNRAHFIVETLHSIQQQTFADWECLIIDDGGTDNTHEVIAPILEKDTRFQFLKRPETYLKGLPGCRNYGLDLAQGDFIIFFDDDDIIHPENLKISISGIIEKKASFLHYQKQSFFIEKPVFDSHKIDYDSWISKKDIYKILTGKIGLASCTVLWHKKCFEQTRFIESLQYAEEWECYTRIITKGFKGISIKNVLYFNRKHPNSNTVEFYKYNPIRRKSYAEAIVLVTKQLQEKLLLNRLIIRYFVQLSLNYKEFKLFSSLMDASRINLLEQLYWYFVYLTLPYRLKLLRRIKRKLN